MSASTNQKSKTKTIITVLVIIGCIVAAVFYFKDFDERSRYQEGVRYLKNGDPEQAAKIFSGLGDYKDAEKMEKEAIYQAGKKWEEAGDYETAVSYYSRIPDYLDSSQRITSCNERSEEESNAEKQALYEQGKKYLDSKDYDNAIRTFMKIKGYLDSDALLEKATNAFVSNVEEETEAEEEEARTEDLIAQYEAYLEEGDIMKAYEALKQIPDTVSGKKENMQYWDQFVQYVGTWDYVSGNAAIMSKYMDEEKMSFTIDGIEFAKTDQELTSDDYRYVLHLDGKGLNWYYTSDFYWIEGSGFEMSSLVYADYYMTINSEGNLVIIRTEDRSSDIICTCEYSRR